MPITKQVQNKSSKLTLIKLKPLKKETPLTKEEAAKNKKSSKVLSEWIEFSPYKRISESQEEEIVLKDNTCLQFLRIEGSGASSVSYEEQRTILSYFYTFLSKNTEHYTTEVTNVPLNLQRQIRYKERRLSALNRLSYTNTRQQMQLEILKIALQKKIKQFKMMEEKMTNIEYVLYLFADDAKTLKHSVEAFAQLARGYRFSVSRLTREEKETLLFQLNNMNTKL